MALCQARQEGGGSILQPLEDLASVKPGINAKAGEKDGHSGHLSLSGWARRHLQSETGLSWAADPRLGPRGRPEAAQTRVARGGYAPELAPPLHSLAVLSRLSIEVRGRA